MLVNDWILQRLSTFTIPVILQVSNECICCKVDRAMVAQFGCTNRRPALQSFHNSPTKIRLSLLALAITGSVG